MADLKISQLTAKGTPIANTDLVEISESDGAGGYVTKSVTGANIIGSKQNTLVSGTNIKTINSTTLLGSGDLTVQPTLVSGTNIKTINSNSILGSGDLVITGGVSSVSATTPVVATGTTTPVISLASNYGDTQNPYASKTANNILAAPNGTAGVPTFRAIVGADIPTLNQNTTGTASNVTGIVAVANGGTGTATPSLVAGTGVTITGTFPNQTIAASGGGGGTEIGALIGGGVVVAVWDQNGVAKALVASLTNLSTALPWTVPAFQSTAVGSTAQSYSNGLTNTNAIIAQTGASATTAYAAGIARLFAGGSFSDWYLPSLWELNICFNSAAIIAKVTGVTSFLTTNYWSSTESSSSNGWHLNMSSGAISFSSKSVDFAVRAVRIHTI
ncbi:MAG: DUF1566 domain-containing protein [Actinobacteria bacterium]|nr:DUF1566 domain-containing protein [Actinomycetota bacterium]